MEVKDAAYTLRRTWSRSGSKRAADLGVANGRVNPKTFTFRMKGVPGYVLFPYDNRRVERVQ